MPESLSSPTRRLLLLGVLVAAGALLLVGRRSAATTPPRAATGGNFGVCAKLKGDAARACYSREVGRELAVGRRAAPRDHARGARRTPAR